MPEARRVLSNRSASGLAGRRIDPAVVGSAGGVEELAGAVVAGCLHGGDGGSELGQFVDLGVDPLDHVVESPALVVTGRGAVVVGSEGVGYLVEREAELLGAADGLEPFDDRRVVGPVAGRGSMGRVDDNRGVRSSGWCRR